MPFKPIDTHGSGPPAQYFEPDPATVEACAKVAEQEGVYPELNVSGGGAEWYRHGKRIASAIRSLIPNSANEIHSSDDSSKPTCELCGAGVVDPCQTKEQQAKCELPSSTFRYGQYDAKVVDPAVTQDCAPGTVSALNSQYAGLEALLAAIHADDPKRELLVRVGDLMRENRALLSQFDVRRRK